MKKLILSAFLLTALLGNISISAQDKIGLQKYDYVTNGDANVFQGIPNIGLPLLGIEVPTTGIGINLSVNYTTESLNRFSLISDAGLGWNLSSVGSIVRDKTRRAEDYSKSTNGKIDSDVFSYSYPGGSGKFFITNNSSTQELEAVHTSPSNDKIAITKDTKEGKIKSFTITDTKGNSYLFDKLNINTINISDITTITRMVNSGFFLSKIFNIKNEEAAVIEYETTTELYNQFLGSLQQQKIKKITVHGIGSIEYLYRHAGPAPLLSAEKNADWYILDKLVLKDTRNTVINQYAFERSGDHLIGLINLDKNSNQIQKFSFEYNPIPSGSNNGSDSFGYPNAFNYCDFDSGILHSAEARNREACTYGALKSITLPSGGKTEYEFESQALPHNNNSASNGYYDHYPFEKIKTITYRTEPGQYPPPYTVPADYKVAMVKFDALYYGPPVRPGTREYSIYINGVEPQLYTYGVNNNEFCQNGMLTFESEGTLNFTFQGKSEGTIELYAFKKTRIDDNDYGHGLRIKSIKNFNSGASSPLSYTKYEYSLFDNPLRSSGTILDQSVELSFIGSRDGIKPIGYTNIKVTDMINGSYSKYYFRNPEDITPGITPSFGFSDKDMSTYIRSMGFLEKKETYSEGQLLQKNEMSYDLKQVPLSNIIEGDAPVVPVKKIIISKQSATTENYISGTAKKLVSTSESTFEDTYSNMTSSKETLSDGTILEKTLLYPADKGIQKLLSANMVDIPLETSTKRNGKLVGKAETKFDDPSHIYATSVIGYNMQTQNPYTASTLDLYDSKGNLVQITGKNGIPTTTIWGYYQTKPIAVIAGAAYSQVASLASVTAAIDASNADRDNPANEPALLQALEALRKDPALKNYNVSATTYDPMIGVTNSISANGIRTVNVYDSANRLMKVTDAEGKTLQETQYNYKHK
ncbi:hypothetical protein [Chryseobacterium sp. OV279]|uniref:hypothetical protein n=1 Tax=Chryseobacterium sp. OV279 TaxID=1500285 RepID=UPI00091B92C4|nr:hypothetical protein [Chryseobacterium sp. OV279]SHF51929.1 hypothetical protein SAMN02787100_2236 [Chryseobacterium sp. OV279]